MYVVRCTGTAASCQNMNIWLPKCKYKTKSLLILRAYRKKCIAVMHEAGFKQQNKKYLVHMYTTLYSVRMARKSVLILFSNVLFLLY